MQDRRTVNQTEYASRWNVSKGPSNATAAWRLNWMISVPWVEKASGFAISAFSCWMIILIRPSLDSVLQQYLAVDLSSVTGTSKGFTEVQRITRDQPASKYACLRRVIASVPTISGGDTFPHADPRSLVPLWNVRNGPNRDYNWIHWNQFGSRMVLQHLIFTI